METKDILKMLRKRNGMTGQEVADGCGMTYKVYQAYESGARNLGVPALQKLADFYGVTTDYLLGRDSESDEQIDKLPIGVHDKAIIQAYISLPQDDRTKLVEILRKITNGADLEVTVDDGIQKTVYTPSEPAPMVARSDKPPNQYTSEQDAQLLSEPDHPDKL